MEYTADNPVALTCSCGGALRKITKGTYTQYRCHIGHTFGTPELASEQFEQLRGVLETATRMLNERAKFFRATASDARLARQEEGARAWEAAAVESEARFKEVRTMLAADWLRPELLPASGSKLRQRTPLRKARPQRQTSVVLPVRNGGQRKNGRGATSKRGGNGGKALA